MALKRERETEYYNNYQYDEYQHISKKSRGYNIENHMIDPHERSIYIAGKKEIHFNSHVSGDTICRFKKLIAEMINDNLHFLIRNDKDSKDSKESNDEIEHDDFTITYIVNSGGGCVHSVLDFVDYIDYQRSIYKNLKFTSIATGMVASAGTTMCAIADNRKITKSAFAMIHELSTGMGRSNYTKIREYAKCLDKIHECLVNIYLRCLNISYDNEEARKELEKKLLDETWMTAQEYLDAGFVSEII
jgi:ATP-dependent protease ClpP protease subunit